MTQPKADLDRFLRAIADPTRRRILQTLKVKTEDIRGKTDPMCAGDIEEGVKLSQPTVSHHMKVLEKAGLIEVKREGHWRRYRRNEKLISEMTRALKQQI